MIYDQVVQLYDLGCFWMGEFPQVSKNIIRDKYNGLVKDLMKHGFKNRSAAIASFRAFFTTQNQALDNKRLAWNRVSGQPMTK